jgi:hypothetical protein
LQSIYVLRAFSGLATVEVTDHRTQVNYAHQMKYLADKRYASAKKLG